MIADHAEIYGLMPPLLSGDPNVLATREGKCWHDALKSGDKKKQFATTMETVGYLSKPDAPFDTRKIVRDQWRKYTALDRIQNQTLWRRNAGESARGDPGTRLHLADLVHARGNESGQEMSGWNRIKFAKSMVPLISTLSHFPDTA